MAKNDDNGGNVAVITPAQMRQQQELEAQMPTLRNAQDIVETIQAQILAGQSDEDVFAAASAGLASGETMVGIPLKVLDYAYNKSAYGDNPGSLPVYAVVKALDLDRQEEVTFSLGALSAVTQLHRFESLKSFRERENGLNMALDSKRTGAGYDVLFWRPLTPAEEKATGVTK